MAESASARSFFLGLGLVGDPMSVTFTPPLLGLGLGVGLVQVLALPANCAMSARCAPYTNAGGSEGRSSEAMRRRKRARLYLKLRCWRARWEESRVRCSLYRRREGCYNKERSVSRCIEGVEL